jgi:isochorismate synthase EntC
VYEREGKNVLTKIERIGKNSGVLICGTPKYLHARSESNLEYVALAGSVQGGLLPV